ncbi:MAG: hypothetical protein LQ342_005571 [Letrouitia transgressa]|nr:MAG: hypothetical protein LQ342_005571 [Letrouitia transgressa]
MPSSPKSPRTPTRRRQASNADQPDCSPMTRSIGYTPGRTGTRRHSSIHSLPSPSTLQIISPHGHGKESSTSIDYGDAITSVNGLGNLADELAVAWEEDGSNGEDKSPSTPQSYPIGANKSRHAISNSDAGSLGHPIQNPHDKCSGFATDSNTLPLSEQSPSSLNRSTQRTRHQRASQTSNDGGSDYGDTSDIGNARGLSPLPLTQISPVESLACQGMEPNECGSEEVILRVASLLRDLGSQNLMETGITRFVSCVCICHSNAKVCFGSLATSYIALATHLTHQTRLLQTLSHFIISPLSVRLDPSIVDSLAPLFSNTTMPIPSPPVEPLTGLHSFQCSTADILTTLSSLADSLHMIRQTSTSASRKLKAAKDAIDELRQEIDATKKGIDWIEQGNWQERLEKRECAKVCRDVVRGFEELCSDWRTKIGGDFVNLKGVEIGV